MNLALAQFIGSPVWNVEVYLLRIMATFGAAPSSALREGNIARLEMSSRNFLYSAAENSAEPVNASSLINLAESPWF